MFTRKSQRDCFLKSLKELIIMILVSVEENLFKKSNLLIGTNSNEVLKGLMEFLPELNGDSVKLELSSLQLDSALNRIFPRYNFPQES